METEKDCSIFYFNCVLRDAEVGGDLLFAAPAQITADNTKFFPVTYSTLRS